MATTTMISELIHTDNVFLFIPNIIGKHPAGVSRRPDKPPDRHLPLTSST